MEPSPAGFVSVSDYLRLPRSPETWLLKDLLPTGGVALMYSPPKVGKALHVETPIPTPSGWTTMADVHPGHVIFGSQGQPVTVLAESDVLVGRSCFTITFDDGNTMVTDAHHEWFARHKTNKKGPASRQIVTTGQMAQHLSISDRAYQRSNWAIPLPQALTFPPLTDSLPIDPYLLGTWLGDGTSRANTITTADPEIVEAWRRGGWTVTQSTHYTYRVTHPRGRVGSLTVLLKTLNVFGNKHIPSTYLRAPVEDRQALLAGLLDTDGCKEGHVAVFYNTNRQLAEHAYELAVSLGAKVAFRSKRASLHGRDMGLCYIVRIRPDFVPFRLPRKAAGFIINQERYHSITAIDRVPPVAMKCIVVDAPDHLFLAGRNCLPTHNSAAAIQLAASLSGEYRDWMGFQVCYPGRVLYLQLDTPRTTWADRFVKLKAHGLRLNDDFIKLADKDSVGPCPFDILQPMHAKHLQALVAPLKPVAVIIDTLREIHSGDEDSSTAMRNVITNLVGATYPAALIIISHDRKSHPDVEKDIMSDHRGSSYVVGRMDAVMRLTKSRLWYSGRSIEEGSIRIKKQDCDGALLWMPDEGDIAPHIEQVLANTSLKTRRDKARVLAPLIQKSEEAANSILRRWVSGMHLVEGTPSPPEPAHQPVTHP